MEAERGPGRSPRARGARARVHTRNVARTEGQEEGGEGDGAPSETAATEACMVCVCVRARERAVPLALSACVRARVRACFITHAGYDRETDRERDRRSRPVQWIGSEGERQR